MKQDFEYFMHAVKLLKKMEREGDEFSPALVGVITAVMTRVFEHRERTGKDLDPSFRFTDPRTWVNVIIEQAITALSPTEYNQLLKEASNESHQ